MKVLFVCTTDSMIWNFLIPHIKYLQEKKYEVECACSRTGFYFDEIIDKHSIIMNEIPFERAPFKVKNFKSLIRLNELVRKKRYDLIVSQEPVGGTIGRLVGKINGCKNIYTAHGFHFYKGGPIKNWLLFYPIEKMLAHITDALITINNEDYTIAKTFKAKSVYKISGIGVNLNRFNKINCDTNKIKNEFEIKENEKIFLTVAELIPRKNYETILKALSKIKDVKFKYIICGDGILKEKLETFVRELHLQDKVCFAGFRKDVQLFYAIADLFLFPSFQEGLSIALIEAMASGIPIVCSKIRGNTDLILEGQGGLLNPPLDVDGFVDSINKVLSQENTYGDFNRKYVKNFSIEKSREEFFSIIEKI